MGSERLLIALLMTVSREKNSRKMVDGIVRRGKNIGNFGRRLLVKLIEEK